MKILIRAVIVAVLIAAGFTCAPARAAGEDIVIGGSLGLTGRFAGFSDMQMKGFMLWRDDVNASGGILGRHVRLEIKDDQSDPTRALNIYRSLMTDGKADLLTAPFSSAITESLVPLLDEHGYPLVVSGASADSIWQMGSRNVFGLFLPASNIGVGFLEMLVMQGARSIAIVHSDDSFSLNIAQGTVRWAESLGLEVRLNNTIGSYGGDYGLMSREVAASGADAVMICAMIEPIIEARRAMALNNGFNGAFYAPVGIGLPEFYEKLGPLAEGVYSTSQWDYHSNPQHPGTREFYERFVKQYGFEPSYFAATAYASGQILKMAVEAAGGLDRQRIREELSRLNASTIVGRYGVDGAGRQMRKTNLVVQVRQGAPVVVWPPGHAVEGGHAQ